MSVNPTERPREQSPGSPPAAVAGTGWRRRRRYVLAAVALGVVAVVGYVVLPGIADWGEVWRIVRDLALPDIALLAVAVVLNLVTFAPSWQAALPGLRFRQAMVVTQASTASTYVAPGGPAVGMALSYAMLRGWGFSSRAVALAVTLTGIWNQLAQLSFPVIALALLDLSGERNAFLQTVALVGLVILIVAVILFGLAMSTDQLAWRIGNLTARSATRVLRLVRRGSVGWNGDSFAAFRREAIVLLRRRWHVLTLSTLAGQLTVFLVLFVSLRVLGVEAHEVSLVEAFAAWALARLLSSIPLTPGGLGIVDVGLTTALVAFGARVEEVVAAVLIFRFLTIVPTVVLGMLAAAGWKRFARDHSEEP